VLESTRAKEDAVRKETAKRLALFRQQQDESEKAARLASTDAGSDAETSATVASGIAADESAWEVSARKRKRSRGKEIGLPGIKLRRTSSTVGTRGEVIATPSFDASPTPTTVTVKVSTLAEEFKIGEQKEAAATSIDKPKPTAALGLDAYSSDED
jgi:hypothetical protein